jgi:hypothetical protein
MGSKHTPGPWTIDRTSECHGQRPYGISAGKRGPTPKNIVNWGGMAAPASQESEANARLIASAPDLLEALTALYASYKALADSGDAGNWRLEDTDEGRQALDAIRKATGEAS